MSYLGTLNSLLTSTTSRYASLRRNILSSSTEDDTGLTDPSSSHVSRVLRAYYTEKSRPFPAWLGLDPRDAAKQQQQGQNQPFVATRPVGSLRGYSSASGGSSSAPPSRAGGAAGGLGDIWGDGGVEERGGGGSLRRGVLGGRRGVGGDAQGQGQGVGGGVNVRPLPSQRVGSYQSRETGAAGAAGGPTGTGGVTGSMGAADRLKARLGGRAGGGSGSGRSTPEFEGGGGGGRYDGGRGGGGGRAEDLGSRAGRSFYDDGPASEVQGGGTRGGGSYATQGLSGWQGRR